MFVPTRWLTEAARLRPSEEKALGDALRAIAVRDAQGHPLNGRREMLGQQRRGFLLPSLRVARQQWEAYKGRPVEWPEDVVDWAQEAVADYREGDMPF